MAKQDDLYIGIMSGTSLDGVDVALLQITAEQVVLKATHSHGLPAALRSDILSLCQPGDNELQRAGRLNLALGRLFADAVNALLQKASLSATAISAIGSHGQTVRHCPAEGFSIQLGSAPVIAALTGIPTVADFRNQDMVHGGQGAPLVPVFHQQLFGCPGKTTAVVNIGGMANVTLLQGERLLGGFDTGPGNVLLNTWINAHNGQDYDRDGKLAASGVVDEACLARCLNDPFFQATGPRSTGRETFNSQWLKAMLPADIKPENGQATLSELTARTITQAISQADPAHEQLLQPDRILVCGGGAHNADLLARLMRLNPASEVQSTASAGWSPDWIEAACFAWLAYARFHNKPATSPLVTGADAACISGAIYLP